MDNFIDAVPQREVQKLTEQHTIQNTEQRSTIVDGGSSSRG